MFNPLQLGKIGFLSFIQTGEAFDSSDIGFIKHTAKRRKTGIGFSAASQHICVFFRNHGVGEIGHGAEVADKFVGSARCGFNHLCKEEDIVIAFDQINAVLQFTEDMTAGGQFGAVCQQGRNTENFIGIDQLLLRIRAFTQKINRVLDFSEIIRCPLFQFCIYGDRITAERFFRIIFVRLCFRICSRVFFRLLRRFDVIEYLAQKIKQILIAMMTESLRCNGFDQMLAVFEDSQLRQCAESFGKCGVMMRICPGERNAVALKHLTQHRQLGGCVA